MPGVQVLAVVLDADRVELGPEYGGVGDGQQVGSLGFDRPVEGADPGLVGGGRRVLEVLSDGDHGYEPAGAGGDHLGAVVRGGQQQRLTPDFFCWLKVLVVGFRWDCAGG